MLRQTLTFLSDKLTSSLLGLIILIGLFFASSAFAQTENYRPLLLAVTINQQSLDETDLFLQTPDGKQLLASKTILQQWQVDLDDRHPVDYQGQPYYYLSSFPGVSYNVNLETMSVALYFPSKQFLSHKYSAINGSEIALSPQVPGGYFNYDLNTQVIPGVSRLNSGLLGAAVFNQYGVGTSNFLLQQQRDLEDPAEDSDEALRLTTTLQHDDVEDMRSIRIGDAYTDAGAWGQSVAFGGIQVATNFNTQPSFITFPLPAAKGEAVVPSAVNLYVNNALVNTQNVTPGPFSINNVPVVNGYGDINVVTTNLLGQQVVSSIPYYSSPELLKPGLQDYSYEAGYVRNNFGIASNDYGRFAAVGTDALGMTDNFTAQGHGELLHDQQTLGIGGNYLIGKFGIVNTAIAASHTINEGQGGLGQVGFQRQSYTGFNYGFNVQVTTNKYNELGLQEGEAAPSLQAQTFFGFPLSDASSVGMSYTRLNNRDDQPNASLLNVSYSRSFGRAWQGSLSGITNVGGESSKIIFASLTKPIGSDTSFSINGTGQANNSQGSIQLNRNLPIGTGYGYNIQAGDGVTVGQNYQTSVSAQNNIGTYTVEAARQGGQTGYQAEASGGIVFIDDNLYLSRQINNSFAVVEAGYPNVGIYNFNELVGTTNANGDLLVPNLVAYQVNPITLDPSTVPLSANLGATQIDAVPYYQSGVVVKFPIQQASAAIMTLELPSKKLVPAGAMAHFNGQDFPVAEDGELYVTGLINKKKNPMVVTWDDSRCEIDPRYVDSKAPIANLGIVVCHEVKNGSL